MKSRESLFKNICKNVKGEGLTLGVVSFFPLRVAVKIDKYYTLDGTKFYFVPNVVLSGFSFLEIYNNTYIHTYFYLLYLEYLCDL